MVSAEQAEVILSLRVLKWHAIYTYQLDQDELHGGHRQNLLKANE